MSNIENQLSHSLENTTKKSNHSRSQESGMALIEILILSVVGLVIAGALVFILPLLTETTDEMKMHGAAAASSGMPAAVLLIGSDGSLEQSPDADGELENLARFIQQNGDVDKEVCSALFYNGTEQVARNSAGADCAGDVDVAGVADPSGGYEIFSMFEGQEPFANPTAANSSPAAPAVSGGDPEPTPEPTPTPPDQVDDDQQSIDDSQKSDLIGNQSEQDQKLAELEDFIIDYN